jgi:hypothetical protein
MSEGPTTGQKLLGAFMILFGLCVTLVGGGCTFMWLSEISSVSHYSYGMGGIANPLLWVSLITFAGGIVCLWVGGKLATGKYRE